MCGVGQSGVVGCEEMNLHFSLHLDHPGDVGQLAKNEVQYVRYSRVLVTKTADGWEFGTPEGWTFGADRVSGAEPQTIAWPLPCSFGGIVRYWAVLDDDGKVLLADEYTPNVPIDIVIQPLLDLPSLDALAAEIGEATGSAAPVPTFLPPAGWLDSQPIRVTTGVHPLLTTSTKVTEE
jgi:hypothetical protein